MRTCRILVLVLGVLSILMGGLAARAERPDPLPSWNEGATKQAILRFVRETTSPGAPRWVPPEERVAVFDNDGTLWCEQPIYVQVAFAFDRVRALAPKHPEWRHTQPFQAVLEHDTPTVLAGGGRALMQIMGATHAGMTTAEFSAIVEAWLATARHPRFGRLYTQLAYQPMLELLAYLRANGFVTYVVSGGGVEFMRPWAEPIYGVPPEQVIGSSSKLEYTLRDGRPVLLRTPEVDFVDDFAGKPVGIEQRVGRRPLFAAGNSDGDFEMLEWTTATPGRGLGILVHHTDGVREYAYDRDSKVGRLRRALDEAPRRGWVVIDMRRDWKIVFAAPDREPPAVR